MNVRRVLAGVVATLVGAAGLPGAASADAPPSEARSSVIRGTIKGANGAPESTAVVALRVLSDSPGQVVGSSSATAVVGVSSSASNGRYAISVNSAKLATYLAKMASSTPTVTVVVEAMDGDGNFGVLARPYVVSNPRTGEGYFESQQVADTAYAIAPSGSSRAPSAVASRAMSNDVSLRLKVGGRKLSATQRRQVVNSLSEAPPVVTSRLIARIGTAQQIVGQGAATSNYGGFSFEFSYSAGARSEVGIAASGQANGGYSGAGTSSVSSTISVGFPAWSSPGMHYHKTGVVWGKFLINEGSMYFPAYYLAKPYAVAGGTYGNVTSTTGYQYCSRYAAGSEFDKVSERAITWTNGAYVGWPVNLSMSAVTGYSSTASIHIEFTANRMVCGSSGYAGEAGQIIQVRG